MSTVNQPKPPPTKNMIAREAILKHSLLERTICNALKECRATDYGACLSFIKDAYEKVVILNELSKRATNDRYPL